ncbi:NADP-dependent aldehyde dehydrogenase [Variovorax sp. HW608]|uniref:aldehyde dehydrogenase (NADP(+)) n=1 Tax=Variovorax sp. HW608 TaxID=1034889 RepID=UPI00081FA91A|nr:aldehyde dehydrogenase (NADP(+)) [Variovorax sp. HW608]SCK12773.1 NADP-dependent aldehyde dehydrogenase [Variovorax sp. HW608]
MSHLESIEAAALAAGAAAGDFAASSAAARARLLRALADALEAGRESLVPLADRETGLGLPRLGGELDRTAFQLRGFAAQLERGAAHRVEDDPAVAGAPPAGRPRLTRVRVPLGPVAMFAASNFPFAFSVLGGDTASALAAGCPVVVKAHPAHPMLSRRTAELAQRVALQQAWPEGVFQFVEGASIETGVRLVQAPGIAAVAFTGSFRGGMALADVAARRPRPIPFFGELGSTNPLIVLPALLARDAEGPAATLAQSICQGSGQFCTSPGVIVVPVGSEGDVFVSALAKALCAQSPHRMLTEGIRGAFDRGVSAWAESPSVHALLAPPHRDAAVPGPFLGEVAANDFVADGSLHEEVFGPGALVVRVGSHNQAIEVLQAIGGSLTVTLWGVEVEGEAARALVRAASRIAGRVLFAGVPTGVAVTGAQQHGGPFPASTQPWSTSVGYAAMDRFLRPVALQDAPAWVLARQGVPC